MVGTGATVGKTHANDVKAAPYGTMPLAIIREAEIVEGV